MKKNTLTQLFCAALILAGAAAPAQADEYPSRPIRMQVGYAAVSYTHLTLPTSDLV